MSQYIYIIEDNNTRHITKAISNQIYVNKVYESPGLILTADILRDMAANCMVEYFYVVVADRDVIYSADTFTFKPEVWDSQYLHLWDDGKTFRLFNKQAVMDSPEKFSDQSLDAGIIDIKLFPTKPYKSRMLDIIFLSYDESYAESNLKNIRDRFPRTQQVKGVKGIFEAHLQAAKMAQSSMFYVVDADADILKSYNFDYSPYYLDHDTVHVWHSINPVNGLEYGYGGVKLFPTQLLLSYNGSPLDFTTSVSSSLKVMGDTSNITRFNTDPYSAWRSGFRECVKLASKVISNQIDTDTEYRLNVWCSVADGEFGEFAVLGAVDGREFGRAYANQPDMLRMINDFDWLEQRFSN